MTSLVAADYLIRVYMTVLLEYPDIITEINVSDSICYYYLSLLVQ